jgi:hypothetical protein
MKTISGTGTGTGTGTGRGSRNNYRTLPLPILAPYPARWGAKIGRGTRAGLLLAILPAN